MSHRDNLTSGSVVTTIFIAGVIAPLTVLRDREQGDGYLWAWADVMTASWPLLLLVALAAGVTVLGSSEWLRRHHRQPANLIGRVLVVGAGFALGAAVAFAIARPLPEYASAGWALLAGLAMAALLLSAILPSRLGLGCHLLGAMLLVLVVAFASGHVDNSSEPVHGGVAVAGFGLPLAAAALARRAGSAPLVLGTGILVGHLALLVPVVVAASSCDDDDCIPAPGWLIAVAFAAVWSLGARIAGLPPVSQGSTEPAESSQRTPRSRWKQSIGVVAPLMMLLLAGAAASLIDLDAEPDVLAATPTAVQAGLPGMIGWSSDRLCADRATESTVTNSTTAVVAGAGLGHERRLEVCFASFGGWTAPSPMALIERPRQTFLLDPISEEMIEVRAGSRGDEVEPPVRPVHYSYEGRGIHRFRRVGGDSTGPLFEVRAGRNYHIRTHGFSDDGSWMFIADSLDRLIVIPVDGSLAPTVLDDRLADAGSVSWGPGTTFVPTTTLRLTDPGDTTYVPDGTDMNEARNMINDLARSFGDEATVEFVIVDDQVYGRFLGLPAVDQTERGLCVWLTAWLETGNPERSAASAIVGDGGMSCLSESESDGYRCGTTLTLPTGVLAGDLTGTVALSVRASLRVPITFPSDPKPWTGLLRERDDWSMGPIRRSDLTELTVDDVACGPQPNASQTEPGE